MHTCSDRDIKLKGPRLASLMVRRRECRDIDRGTVKVCLAKDCIQLCLTRSQALALKAEYTPVFTPWSNSSDTEISSVQKTNKVTGTSIQGLKLFQHI